MRVVFEPVTPDPSEQWERVFDMDAVPRIGEDVEIDGADYSIVAVIWDPDDNEVTVRVR